MSLKQAHKKDCIKHQVSGGYKYPSNLLENKKYTLKDRKKETHENPNPQSDELLPISKQEAFEKNKIDIKASDDWLLNEIQEDTSCFKSRREIADIIIKNIEKKLEKLQKNRVETYKKVLEKRKENEMIENNINGQNVTIYEGNERRQYASHLQSNLNSNTIENVEALIVILSNFRVRN